MNDKPKRPLSVWLSQVFLGMSSLFFSAVVMVAILDVAPPFWTMFYGVVLVVMPVLAIIGISMGRAWGRRFSQVSFLCLFAFNFKFVLSTANSSPRFLPPELMAVFLILPLFAFVAAPYILFRFSFGEAEERYFANTSPLEVLPAHLSDVRDSIPGLDESFVER